jgi:predicted GH43/DUF377 family glycosyl hydrolase
MVYPDHRPFTTLRMNATDQGILIRYGDGPQQCDSEGMREALIFRENDLYYLFYDGCSADGHMACLATSVDLLTWTKHGYIMDRGLPGELDAAAVLSPWVYHEHGQWHMFYIGTPNKGPAPDYVPAFPYLTFKATSKQLAGPWLKQKEVVPFRLKPGSYYSDTASAGYILRDGDTYLQFISATTTNAEGIIKRTLGIARTNDLNHSWEIDPEPLFSIEEQVENSFLYYEPTNQTWFLFTNHIGLNEQGVEYTDAIWVYWSKDLTNWSDQHKAVVLDSENCTWSKQCIGLPSIIQVGDKLALFYDAPGGDSISHQKRHIGLAWLQLPLVAPVQT